MAKNSSKRRDAPLMITNKKARYNYEIVSEIEAGIVLSGTEVKSLRAKKVDLAQSYALLKRNKIILLNMRIEPYSKGNYSNHEPTRSRTLLLHKKEIDTLASKVKERGWVLIPLSIYLKKQYFKVLLGLGKGKKKYDKRLVLKERDIQRDISRAIKYR